jgi:transposase
MLEKVPHVTESKWQNVLNTQWKETPLTDSKNDKEASLRRYHALNPRAESVVDHAFTSDSFFDARDVVQVKYEMLRRVRAEGATVSDAAAAFGLSRPSFYEARAAFESGGLPGLLPKRPGPRRAHKLSETVVSRLDQAREAEPSLRVSDLVALVQSEFGLSVHPRSVERALARLPKGPREDHP